MGQSVSKASKGREVLGPVVCRWTNQSNQMNAVLALTACVSVHLGLNIGVTLSVLMYDIYICIYIPTWYINPDLVWYNGIPVHHTVKG